ncbi:hypothetical protein Tco_0491142 [Tanacetum coccineum]
MAALVTTLHPLVLTPSERLGLQDQGGLSEVPKIRIEAKNQEKKALEIVSRRTNPKTLIRPILAQICLRLEVQPDNHIEYLMKGLRNLGPLFVVLDAKMSMVDMVEDLAGNAAYFTANNDVGSSPNNAFSKPDPHAHDKTSPPGPFDGDKVIPKNQVVVVVGESDTRNTTQPPQYLHKDGYTKNGKQPELENHVGVGGYGYPAFIPLNIKNGAYALLKRDTFTDGSVKCTMTSMTASEPVVSLAVSPFSKDSGNKCGYCLRKSFGIRNMTWISTAAKMF